MIGEDRSDERNEIVLFNIAVAYFSTVDAHV